MTAPDAAALDLDQPWVPDGAPTFKVGDRVRVRLSGECRCYKVRTQVGQRFEGMTGTIIATDNLGRGRIIAHHQIEVEPDRAWWLPGSYGRTGHYPAWFAAIELEPVEDALSDNAAPLAVVEAAAMAYVRKCLEEAGK